MSARSEEVRGSRRLGLLLATTGFLIALILLAPSRGRASDWKSCVDDSFLDYNNCLMGGDGWFERKLCDLNWEFDVALCTAQAVGEIRKAWNGD